MGVVIQRIGRAARLARMGGGQRPSVGDEPRCRSTREGAPHPEAASAAAPSPLFPLSRPPRVWPPPPPRPVVPPQRPRRRSVPSPVSSARRRVSSAWLVRRRLRPFLAPLLSLKRPFYAPLLLRNSGPETARVSREGGGCTAGGGSGSRRLDWLGAGRRPAQ